MNRLEIAARIAAGLATNPSGAIVQASLEIADELIRLEAETRPKQEQELPFEMVVGGVYVNRIGETEEIVGKDESSPFHFLGKSRETYTEGGSVYNVEKSKHDLIKRIR